METEEIEVQGYIATKRKVLAQVVVCSGCCCGRTDKGRPAIPLEWLKKTWKERKLLKTVQLTISGCLGPCDIANVVSILSKDVQLWFGGFSTEEPYHELLAWAEATRELGTLAHVPKSLLPYQFTRFSESE
ncbi:(2Fe-2S) ferredoxin domain-containing protein [Sulfoacidibacillus thermotolerans]|uniref:Cobalt chelatase n=1 Tax=Sulfoacidibacillus thermotolerans TaxID=1765684 RepID=A0A2U3D788_SULT2|nr:(2Fe-2S) ferredoxin domain-containing protein [Sulfoacidibacillus thermotolerans]PWI57142.1 cobalt chelatase [Sulfoacidibacillus thermotolerans]